MYFGEVYTNVEGVFEIYMPESCGGMLGYKYWETSKSMGGGWGRGFGFLNGGEVEVGGGDVGVWEC